MRGRRPAALGLWLVFIFFIMGGCAAAAAQGTAGASFEERFREAGEAVRGGDYPRATGLYRALAASGGESASLYWNWAQAASARGAAGEALWALARAREVEPGDAAVRRELERLREAANLDPAEVSPEPLASLGVFSRRFHLALAAVVLLALSFVVHAAARVTGVRRRWAPAAVLTFVLGLGAAAPPLLASFARPTAVVLRRGAPLLESASPSADPIGALREGEVVPILSDGTEFLRVEDSSGARGWAHADDLGRLDRPPRPR
jgi:hypothetical protein